MFIEFLLEFYLQIYDFPNTMHQNESLMEARWQGQRQDLHISDSRAGPEKGEAPTSGY